MRNAPLARDYLQRAQIRLRAVQLLLELNGWADAVRESQEVVERALKSLLRQCTMDPPGLHDVSDAL